MIIMMIMLIMDIFDSHIHKIRHYGNYARRLRLEKRLYLELSRGFSGNFNPLLGQGDRSASKTAARPLRNRFRSQK